MKLPSQRVILLAATLLALSGCIRSVAGPNDNAPEQFDFTTGPATRVEVENAFRTALGTQFANVVPGSFVAVGRIVGARGDIFISEFQMEDPQTGLSECTGQAGPYGAGWSCGPVGQELTDSTAALLVGGSSIDDRWATVEFNVSDDVAYLVATADDGTRYRMDPLAGHAWMEWRTEHGDLVVNAFDSSDAVIGVADVESST